MINSHFTYLLTRVTSVENATCFTKAYVSPHTYQDIMNYIKDCYANREHWHDGPYIKIEGQTFELISDMNMSENKIAINSYQRSQLKLKLGELVKITFLETDLNLM